ncbi:MAG: fibronectin type III domain-containing protein, partial [Treponema sp.]|nr:fibronectin type III domain-containing protein [Treponema sp.]
VNSGSFNMTAGTISGNTTSAFGGGVYVNTGFTFTMSGGTISGNSAIGNTSFGGGVYIANTATFIKEPPSGGAISGIIYGYDAADPDNPNNNVVRNASNDVLSSRGHAVFFAIMPTARFRDRTANENDTMDTTVAGTPGSWDN